MSEEKNKHISFRVDAEDLEYLNSMPQSKLSEKMRALISFHRGFSQEEQDPGLPPGLAGLFSSKQRALIRAEVDAEEDYPVISHIMTALPALVEMAYFTPHPQNDKELAEFQSVLKKMVKNMADFKE